jgi:hypothetical protein
VEAVPEDPYYLFGKLRFDKELYMGRYSSKDDWLGNLPLDTLAALATRGTRWWKGGSQLSFSPTGGAPAPPGATRNKRAQFLRPECPE